MSNKVVGASIAVVVFLWLLQAAFFGVCCWVAWHFISKWW